MKKIGLALLIIAAMAACKTMRCGDGLTMIYGTLNGNGNYHTADKNIALALHYLDTVSSSVNCGKYEIAPGIFATVSEYTTKEKNPAGYEAHRKYIDIQYLIEGEEKILVSNVNTLTESKKYNEKNDCARYQENGKPQRVITLGNKHYAIFYPVDAHIPGLTCKTQQKVKKIVVKIPVGQN